MRKPLLLVIIAVIISIHFAGAQVNEEELGGLDPVEFINYEGPYSRIDTRSQIRDIGYSLGVAVRNGTERPGALNRYFVISSRSEPDGTRLDADIFGLGVDTMVDHIRNLRLIVQGYLEAAYNYSESDAALLAQYITVYNAVYRGNLGFFEPRYRRPVLTHLNRERVGLAIRFDEWPGQTLMVIPIGSGLGGPLSAVDTWALNDPAVREQLRQEPDSSLEQRRDFVDLLEREAEQAAEIAAATREAVRQEEASIAQERAEIQQQVEQARQQVEQAQQDLEQAVTTREVEETQQQVQEALEQLEEALQREEELAEREVALEELREEAERQEEFAAQRLDEAREERMEIADDQQAILAPPPTRIQEGETVLGVTIVNHDTGLGRLVRLDINTGGEISRSPITTVNIRSILRLDTRIIAIAGENRGNSAVRIVDINAQSLEMISQGDDDIAESSLLWFNGQELFAITNSGGILQIGRFNLDFVLQARSTAEVHPYASILFAENRIITQRPDGSALLLNRENLSEIR